MIPKSVNQERITQNFQVFDFKLSAVDIAQIDSFDCNGRLLLMTGFVDFTSSIFTILNFMTCIDV